VNSKQVTIEMENVNFLADGVPQFPEGLPDSLTNSSPIIDVENVKAMTITSSNFFGSSGTNAM
jgi:hypothetical protein